MLQTPLDQHSQKSVLGLFYRGIILLALHTLSWLDSRCMLQTPVGKPSSQTSVPCLFYRGIALQRFDLDNLVEVSCSWTLQTKSDILKSQFFSHCYRGIALQWLNPDHVVEMSFSSVEVSFSLTLQTPPWWTSSKDSSVVMVYPIFPSRYSLYRRCSIGIWSQI